MLKARASASRSTPTTTPSDEWTGVLDTLLGSIDILLPNEDEIRRITGQPTLERALDVLAPRVPLIVVKCGSRGAVVQQGKRRDWIAPIPVEPIDTIGAGDSFNAGFLHAYLKGESALRSAAVGQRHRRALHPGHRRHRSLPRSQFARILPRATSNPIVPHAERRECMPRENLMIVQAGSHRCLQRKPRQHPRRSHRSVPHRPYFRSTLRHEGPCHLGRYRTHEPHARRPSHPSPQPRRRARLLTLQTLRAGSRTRRPLSSPSRDQPPHLHGRNGTMSGAAVFSNFCQKSGLDLRIIGVPKTIDNDISNTDRCPGFASAARFVAQSTLDLAMTSARFLSPYPSSRPRPGRRLAGSRLDPAKRDPGRRTPSRVRSRNPLLAPDISCGPRLCRRPPRLGHSRCLGRHQ